MIHRAVIMARGLGTRMRRAHQGVELDSAGTAAADQGIKGMIPIDRPFLDYVISALADAGIEDVCLVIGPPPEHDTIRQHYSNLKIERVRIHFAIQQEPRGTADAVLAARPFAGRDPFLVLNSDNYYPVQAYRKLIAAPAPALIGFEREALLSEGNIPPERIARFALVESDKSGFLIRLTEKPDAATFQNLVGQSLISMNLWSFTHEIFAACEQVEPSGRGELELADAVMVARDQAGVRFTVVPFSGAVLDLSTRADIQAVKDRLAKVHVAL